LDKMTLEKFNWYFNRLLAMSVLEIFIRIFRFFRTRYWLVKRPLTTSIKHKPILYKKVYDFNNYISEEIILEADKYLLGEYNMLSIQYTEKKIFWHRDFLSKKNATKSYSLLMNYKNYKLYGDARNIWEKNRHHHLVILGLAYAFTKNAKYSDEIYKQIQSWIDDNSFLDGINWSSSLELGIRLISWVWIYRLIAGSDAHLKLFSNGSHLFNVIYSHQWLIRKNYSIGSSANNHLIGEISGLYISSLVWPIYTESEKWNKWSQSILEREIIKQHYNSGINKEQAYDYQLFSIEFLLLALFESNNNKPFSAQYSSYLSNAIKSIIHLTDIGYNMPRYGDSDNGYVLRLYPLKKQRINWIYYLSNSLLNTNLPLNNKNNIDLYSKLFSVKENSHQFTSIKKLIYNPEKIKDSGIYILSNKRNQSDEIFCLFDAGPLGYLKTAAHGHADSLSFVLSIGGVPFIIDTGTYKYYNNEKKWREYFRGTKSHNTISVDSCDQSEQRGPFLWSKKANILNVHYQVKKNGGIVEASHDGYKHLFGKPIHKRMINLNGNQFLIKDSVEGRGDHLIEFRLHFHPNLFFELNNDEYIFRKDEISMHIQLDKKMKWTLKNGADDAGWYSECYNDIQTTNTLIGYLNCSLPCNLENKIKIL